MPQSITNVFSVFVTGVSLSIDLNEFELMVKPGDRTECLKHSDRSFTRGDSTVDIKVSFVDVVDML